MLDESLAYKNSVIHQIDPVVRIVAAFFMSVFAALSQSFLVLFLYFLISLILVLSASLKFSEVIKRLKPLLWFLLMIWIILPVTFNGEPLFSIWILEITRPGILLSALISIKSVAILLIFTSLLATMTVSSLGSGLHRLLIPDKLVLILLMTYRYVFVIENEYRRLIRAAKLRGFKPGTNLHSYRTYAYLVGMLFVRASLRAKRVYNAMLCRGFQGKFNTLEIFNFGQKDLFFFLFIIFLTTLLLTAEFIWKI